MSTEKNRMDIFLSDRLTAARKRTGLKQKEVAEKLGIPSVTVNRWENGKRTPSATSLNQLAALYQCDLRELIEGGEKTRGEGQGTGHGTVSEQQPPHFHTGRLTDDEHELLILYRAAAPDRQRHLIDCARMCVDVTITRSESPGNAGGVSDSQKKKSA